MLLRTKSREIALLFRVACISVISLSYLIIGVFFTSGKRFESLDNNYENQEAPFHSRHLLAVQIENDNNHINIQNVSEATVGITTIHPWNYTQNVTINVTIKNCTMPAINEFPSDGLTRDQRQHGWVIIHVILVCYLFLFLAVVCEEYFVPCIKRMCHSMNLKEDIAGATFMATASSSAEIFINSIGTFITQGDLGVGTIVGSAVFNILAVPACCGFFAKIVLDLEWYPITRDSLVYMFSVIMLIVFLQDGKIYCYEALLLVLFYVFYVLVMLFNDSICAYVSKVVVRVRRKGYYRELRPENQPLLLHSNGKVNHYNGDVEEILSSDVTLQDIEELDGSSGVWEWPCQDSTVGKTWWIIKWPISLILSLTIPSTRSYPKLYIVTFSMCVIWIGGLSYLVAWLITIIGDTLGIPDSVMGLTFLAAGSSVPEAVSSVLVTNQGHGSMGISSSIGSNTFDILLCLGIPWYIKSSYYPKVDGEHWITINSQGINYSTSCLLVTLVLLYVSICFNRFKLDWKIGLTCLIMYAAFLVFATLVELNVFFPVNVPTCGR